MGVINMAHGEFIMAGGYTAYVVQKVTPAPGPHCWSRCRSPSSSPGRWAAPRGHLIRRLYGRPLDTLLVTWGVGLMLQQLARDIFGAPNVNVGRPGVARRRRADPRRGCPQDPPVHHRVSGRGRVAALAITLTVTPMGRRIRAVMQNRDLAAASGISRRATDITTFFIGSGLAGVAGVA